MGIFYDQVTVINLAPISLAVTFDGQTTRVPPGESTLPKVVLPYAKNQNVIMGSHDADNPNISGALYLISVKGSKKDRQDPLTKEEWQTHLDAPSRINTDQFFEDRLAPNEKVITRGKGRKLQARSLFDAGVKDRVSVDDTAQ